MYSNVSYFIYVVNSSLLAEHFTHELNISSPLSLARFSLTQQLIYKNTKLKNKILVQIFLYQTPVQPETFTYPKEYFSQLHKDPYSFLCTLDQIFVFVLLIKSKEHLRIRTLSSQRYIIISIDQSLGKQYCMWEESKQSQNQLGILPVPQNIRPKCHEDIYFQPMQLHKSITLVNELQRLKC